MSNPCISEEYKIQLKNLLGKKMESIIPAIVESFTICPEFGGAVVSTASKAAEEAGKRAVPVAWGVPVKYYDKEGTVKSFTSPSALVRELGLPMSGTVCDLEGKKCRATDTIEILRISGFNVPGTPKKASAGGKLVVVYNPESPQVKSGKLPETSA